MVSTFVRCSSVPALLDMPRALVTIRVQGPRSRVQPEFRRLCIQSNVSFVVTLPSHKMEVTTLRSSLITGAASGPRVLRCSTVWSCAQDTCRVLRPQ